MNHFVDFLCLGDPPIKAVKFDGYLVLKSTLNGDKIPICRVKDLEITLVDLDLPLRVQFPSRDKQDWRSSSELHAAEAQCKQLSLALRARHESEVYVATEAQRNTADYLHSSYKEDLRSIRSPRSAESTGKHLEERRKFFEDNRTSIGSEGKSIMNNNFYPQRSAEHSTHSNRHDRRSDRNSHPKSLSTSIISNEIKTHSFHSTIPDKCRRTNSRHSASAESIKQIDSSNRFRRMDIK